MAWESTTGNHKSDGKETGWVVYDWTGTQIDGGSLDDGSSAAGTVHLYSGAAFVELLWVKVAAEPLVGTLRHQILGLE
ncbi:MAG: hypothetical protein AAB383_03755 [Patescibacteria group bacterium]